MLIFDFDGVLMYSLDEVTVSAYNAVTGRLTTAIEQLPIALVNLFKQNRFHFQPAGDALPLMSWCLDNYQKTPDKILVRVKYQEIIKGATQPLIKRSNQLYAARNRFIQRDKRRWFSMHMPFQPLWNALIERGSQHVIILTNKNCSAVLNLCHYFDLRVPEENIYAGDNGATKITNLNNIFKRFPVVPYCFIDDSLQNLRDLDIHFNAIVKRLSLLLASWGFIGPDDIREAQTYGYPALTQNDLIDKGYVL